MTAPLTELFAAVDVRFQMGSVHAVDVEGARVLIDHPAAQTAALGYDRLILAAGSHAVHPDIPGLSDHAFSIDTRAEADRLWHHIQRLRERPISSERNTVVIAGGGFTGIEAAAEMPHRLRASLGTDVAIRVIVVERENAIGPDLGPGPRPVIEEAFSALGVETILGVAVARLDATGVTLDDGAHIPSSTVIWTGGLRATCLTEQFDAPRDAQGRLIVDRYLHVPGYPRVFATGDAARAQTDDVGNTTVMSCQHAMPLGRFAGHNAAAELLGGRAVPYHQERYGTCLDLGPWGAVLTEGWERNVVVHGTETKAIKTQINSMLIYPPAADRTIAFAAADPEFAVVA